MTRIGADTLGKTSVESHEERFKYRGTTKVAERFGDHLPSPEIGPVRQEGLEKHRYVPSRRNIVDLLEDSELIIRRQLGIRVGVDLCQQIGQVRHGPNIRPDQPSRHPHHGRARKPRVDQGGRGGPAYWCSGPALQRMAVVARSGPTRPTDIPEL